jgi:hypothetical protein
MKILIAVDGSECSDVAVEEVAKRPWPADKAGNGRFWRLLTDRSPPNGRWRLWHHRFKSDRRDRRGRSETRSFRQRLDEGHSGCPLFNAHCEVLKW